MDFAHSLYAPMIFSAPGIGANHGGKSPDQIIED